MVSWTMRSVLHGKAIVLRSRQFSKACRNRFCAIAEDVWV